MGIIAELVLFGGLVPAAVAAAAMLVWRQAARTWVGPGLAVATASAVAFIGAFAGLGSENAPWLPEQPWHWLPYLALLALLLTLLSAAKALRGWALGLLYVAAVAAAAWVLVPEFIRPSAIRFAWQAAAAAVGLGLLAGFKVAVVGRPRAFGTVLILALLAAVPVLEAGGNLRFAHLALGAAAAFTTSLMALAAWAPASERSEGIEGLPAIAALLLGGLVIEGYFYGFEVPALSYALLLAAPLAPALETAFGRWTAKYPGLLSIILAMAALGSAVVLALTS